MSGTNPFRRRVDQPSSKPGSASYNAVSVDRTEARVPPIDTDIPRPKLKTGKTVRIISPHSATSDEDDGLPRSFSSSARDLTSPPPPMSLSPKYPHDEAPDDPFSARSDGTFSSVEDEKALSNSRTPQVPALGPSAIPANPFKGTSASLGSESRSSLVASSAEHHVSGVDLSIPRQQYDVDDFKRLLLTGEKSRSGASVPAAPSVSFLSQHAIGDNSSNTDASSISRHSIFEPVAGPLQESPTSSHESSPSDDDRQYLVGSLLSASQKSKPATPRHRHGKLVKANAPQTVSFEDPSLSFSNPDNASKPPETKGSSEKPLPPLPPSSAQLDSSLVTGDATNLETIPTSNEVPSSPAIQKRNPPVPPVSRRYSQLKQKSSTNSEKALSISEEMTTESGTLSQSPPGSSSKAPPPPPPRRAGGVVRVNSSSSASTGASIPPSQSYSSADDMISNSPKPRPPAAQNRSPTVFPILRQPSSSLSGSPATAPPPPPPPRRRGSSQSSYTPSRLSGDYRTAATERLRSDSGASSISHLQMTPMTPTPSSTESKDVMADLSALQREVDELRGKFRG